jgi:hypothetical protein
VHLDRERPDQAQAARGVGEDADDVGASLDLLVQALEQAGRLRAARASRSFPRMVRPPPRPLWLQSPTIRRGRPLSAPANTLLSPGSAGRLPILGTVEANRTGRRPFVNSLVGKRNSLRDG